MRITSFMAAAALSAATSLCVVSSHKGETNGARNHATQSSARSGISLAPEADIGPEEAARFAKQASFGPTPELINSIISRKSISKWIDGQFELRTSSYSDLTTNPIRVSLCLSQSGADFDRCYRDYMSALPVQMRFYKNAISNEDQLRQRVAFALSQIIVTSEVETHHTAGLAAFHEILLSNSFGNYRDILESTTLNGYMGDYLDMADSIKSQPNENYARELLQLFTIGPNILNPDGTLDLDNSGAPIASFSNTDVKEIARALTGWTFARLNGAALTDYDGRDLSKAMVINAPRFDTGSKNFLGRSVKAEASQKENVDAVIDAVFRHPNTAPFVSKRLIQRLTVANPSPAYVERVATAFSDNGKGVRGDMKAVVRAIYLDSEARVISQRPGKIKEPILLATSLARAIGFSTDGAAFVLRDTSMGQTLFRPPSVFGYYPSDFPLSGGANMSSPESKLMNTSTSVSRHNFVYDWTIAGDNNRSDFVKISSIQNAKGTIPDWASWESYGTDDSKIVDRINLVLLNGTMTTAQRQSVLSAMAAVKNSNAALQTRKRAQVALYIVASSPLFQVDR